MGILSVQTDVAGQIGVNPRRVKIITTDNLATVTAAGYLSGVMKEGYLLYPTDFIDMVYNYVAGTNSGTNSVFTVSFSNGIPTLAQNSGGTAGDKAASNNSSPTVASVNGAPVVANDVVIFGDTAGSVADSGVALSAVQLSANIHANSVAWAGGGTSHAFTITGLTTASIVIPVIQAQTTGTVYIESYTVTANTLTVTFSADPGAMVLQYVAFIAPQ